MRVEKNINHNAHDITAWPREIHFLEMIYEQIIDQADSVKRIRVFLPNGMTVNGKGVGTCYATIDEAAKHAERFVMEQAS